MLDRHATDVAVVQEEVMQTASDSAAVALSCTAPNPSPEIVTELPPLMALFRMPYDSTAASKV
jgi:hypothetical protein